jgi:hypothetical protein
MPMVAGQIIFELRRPKKYRGPMPSEINVLIQLSTGLEFIHEMGYVHTVTSANLGTFSFGWIQLENKC